MGKNIIILLAIFLFGLFLRFYKLSGIPVSLYWDEVSIGYNAFSIIKTLRDEWGRFLPWFFEAFGEFKFPVSIYLVAVPIKIFGLTDFAVRFASAFLGSLSIPAMYLLSNRIFEKKKIGLLSAFLFCVSPWSLQFSRGMFESNLSVFFLITALFFLISHLIKKRYLFFLFFIISAFLCIYSYGAMLVILPLLTFLAVLIFGSNNKNEKIKQTVFITIAVIVLYLPFLMHVKQNSYLRLNQVSIFSQNPVLEKLINLRTKHGKASGILLNKYSAALINFGNNFISFINPQFLWPGKDGNPRHYNGFGLIYPVEFIFLFIGAVSVFIWKRKLFFFLILGLLIPYAASSFTKDSPHALRSLSSVVSICFLSAFGLHLFSKKKLLCILIVFAYFFLINQYLTKYFVHTSKSSSAWGMENRLMMEQAKKLDINNKTVFFSGDYWRSYIYYYYHFKISPELVQQNNNSTRLANAYFGYAKWDKSDRRYDFNFKPESLFSGESYFLFLSPSEKTAFSKILQRENAELLKDFYYNGINIFAVYEK